MAFSGQQITIPGTKAGGDYSAATNQFTIVKLTASGVVETSGAGEKSIGVLQNRPNEDQEASVCVQGVTKVQAGAVVLAGAQIAADADGRAVTAAGPDYSIGVAVTASTGADGYVTAVVDGSIAHLLA